MATQDCWFHRASSRVHGSLKVGLVSEPTGRSCSGHGRQTWTLWPAWRGSCSGNGVFRLVLGETLWTKAPSFVSAIATCAGVQPGHLDGLKGPLLAMFDQHFKGVELKFLDISFSGWNFLWAWKRRGTVTVWQWLGRLWHVGSCLDSPTLRLCGKTSNASIGGRVILENGLGNLLRQRTCTVHVVWCQWVTRGGGVSIRRAWTPLHWHGMNRGTGFIVKLLGFLRSLRWLFGGFWLPTSWLFVFFFCQVLGPCSLAVAFFLWVLGTPSLAVCVFFLGFKSRQWHWACAALDNGWQMGLYTGCKLLKLGMLCHSWLCQAGIMEKVFKQGPKCLLRVLEKRLRREWPQLSHLSNDPTTVYRTGHLAKATDS